MHIKSKDEILTKPSRKAKKCSVKGKFVFLFYKSLRTHEYILTSMQILCFFSLGFSVEALVSFYSSCSLGDLSFKAQLSTYFMIYEI